MKKTCLGCRAYGLSCELGYKMYQKPIRTGYTPVPLEQCPKPRTNDIFVELFERRHEATPEV